MKDSINFYYNLNIAEVENFSDFYRFKINNTYFFFVPLKRNTSELNNILEISKELKLRNIEVHDIIYNKFGNIITNVFNFNYILLKPIGNIYTEYGLEDILRINKSLTLVPSKIKQYHNSWSKLWSDKLDYFEYQIHELGKGKDIVLASFSYYLGLGENAVSYVNSTKEKYVPSYNDKITLSHRRINYPNYKLNYYNPLSFIIDLEVRDIASYLKSAFMAGEDSLNYLKLVLKLNNFSIYSLEMLYARLLYPTYYFDIYENIMNKNLEEESLIPIIDKVEAYENFLKQAYYEIAKYAPIERIEWITKN